MNERHLPEIDQTIPTLNPESIKFKNSNKKTFSYFEALRGLKDITTKLAILKNRINLLSFKQVKEKDKNLATLNYQKKKERLRTISSQDNEKYRRQFENVQKQLQQEIQAKRIENDLIKNESERRIIKAKKMITEEKDRSYKSIRQNSQSNQQKILFLKQSELIAKQRKHEELYKKQLDHVRIIHNLKQSRIKTIKGECQTETQFILQRIKEKQIEFQKMQEICNNYDNQHTQTLFKHTIKLNQINDPKINRIRLGRTPLSMSKESILTSPSRAISFVIVP